MLIVVQELVLGFLIFLIFLVVQVLIEFISGVVLLLFSTSESLIKEHDVSVISVNVRVINLFITY